MARRCYSVFCLLSSFLPPQSNPSELRHRFLDRPVLLNERKHAVLGVVESLCVDAKDARRLALRRGAIDGSEQAGCLVDLEQRNGVIAAVRSVKKLTFGVDRNLDRKSTRLNSSHLGISYAVFC